MSYGVWSNEMNVSQTYWLYYNAWEQMSSVLTYCW